MTSRLHLILPAIFLLAFAGWLFSDEVAPPDLNSALKNVEQSLQQLQKEIKDLQGSVKDLSRSVKASRETRPVSSRGCHGRCLERRPAAGAIPGSLRTRAARRGHEILWPGY